jgi:hypothetical protein
MLGMSRSSLHKWGKKKTPWSESAKDNIKVNLSEMAWVAVDWILQFVLLGISCEHGN